MREDFKAFLLRGNVLDLAVGVVIGAAFGRIITSVVEDILMPALGLLVGKVNFTNLFLTISGPHAETLEEARRLGAVTINYGLLLNNGVNFLVIALAIFLVLRIIRRANPEPDPAPAPATVEPRPEEQLLTEIRDLLREQRGAR
ncbi:MAG: large-conductance mechanosensitive channel protein MscL [Blastocatellia bacterium]